TARRYRTAADSAATGCAPPFFLRDGIPRNEHSPLAFRKSWSDRRQDFSGWCRRTRRWSCWSRRSVGAATFTRPTPSPSPAASAARRSEHDAHVLAARSIVKVLVFCITE